MRPGAVALMPPGVLGNGLSAELRLLGGFPFYAPRTSTITQSRGAGTPTETRATVATVMGYAADATLADGQTLLTVAADELRHEGARRVSEGVWSTVDADGAPIPAATLKGAVVEAAATNLTYGTHASGGSAFIANNGANTLVTTSAVDSNWPGLPWLRVEEKATTATHSGYWTNAAITANTTNTVSVDLMQDTVTKARVSLGDAGFSNGCFVDVDLASGAVLGTGTTGTGTYTDSDVVELEKGGYRVSLTGKAAAATTATYITVHTLRSAGTPSYLGEVGYGIYAIAGQAETNAYSTSPIINTSTVASAARNADVLDDQVASNLSAAAGTVAFTWTPSHDPSGTIALCGSYVDASNYTALLHDATKYIWRKRIAGVNYDAELTAAYANGTSAKIALYLGASGINLAVDGTLGTANTTGIEGVQYGKLPGTAGAYFSTPDSVASSITGDIECIARVKATDWIPTAQQRIFSKWEATGNKRSWSFSILGDDSGANAGKFIIESSPDGTAAAIVQNIASAANTLTNGTTYWLKMNLDVNDGSGNRVANFYYAADQATEPTSWTQIGTTITTAGVTTIPDNDAAVELGSINSGTVQLFIGNIYRAQIYNTIDGTTPVVDFNPADYTNGTTWTSSATGEVYTINGNAAVWPAVKLGTRWQWGADGNGGQQAGAAFKEMYLSPESMSDAELLTITR